MRLLLGYMVWPTTTTKALPATQGLGHRTWVREHGKADPCQGTHCQHRTSWEGRTGSGGDEEAKRERTCYPHTAAP